MFHNLNLKILIAKAALLVFVVGLCPVRLEASQLTLPKPNARLPLSPEFNPPVLAGMKVNPRNPLHLDFILKPSGKSQLQLAVSTSKLVKYFLAALTTPAEDVWVNLSPYEKDRIVPEAFGTTEMGRDLLAQDYILKQITASLIYPDDETGIEFWKQVYRDTAQKYGTSNVPVNTFNKVWIVPDRVVIYENAKAGTVFIKHSRLKVMLEEDYVARKNNKSATSPQGITSEIIRSIVIPRLEQQVNEGEHFAVLRQIYASTILAHWYKHKVKESILNLSFQDQNKTDGLMVQDMLGPQKIYEHYLKAFKQGAYSFIKEEQGPGGAAVTRKYFAGGVAFKLDHAMASNDDVPYDAGAAAGELMEVAVDFVNLSTKKPQKVINAEAKLRMVRLQELLDQREYTSAELVKETGSDLGTLKNDLYHSKLIRHPNLSLQSKRIKIVTNPQFLKDYGSAGVGYLEEDLNHLDNVIAYFKNVGGEPVAKQIDVLLTLSFKGHQIFDKKDASYFIKMGDVYERFLFLKSFMVFKDGQGNEFFSFAEALTLALRVHYKRKEQLFDFVKFAIAVKAPPDLELPLFNREQIKQMLLSVSMTLAEKRDFLIKLLNYRTTDGRLFFNSSAITLLVSAEKKVGEKQAILDYLLSFKNDNGDLMLNGVDVIKIFKMGDNFPKEIFESYIQIARETKLSAKVVISILAQSNHYRRILLQWLDNDFQNLSELTKSKMFQMFSSTLIDEKHLMMLAKPLFLDEAKLEEFKSALSRRLKRSEALLSSLEKVNLSPIHDEKIKELLLSPSFIVRQAIINKIYQYLTKKRRNIFNPQHAEATHEYFDHYNWMRTNAGLENLLRNINLILARKKLYLFVASLDARARTIYEKIGKYRRAGKDDEEIKRLFKKSGYSTAEIAWGLSSHLVDFSLDESNLHERIADTALAEEPEIVRMNQQAVYPVEVSLFGQKRILVYASTIQQVLEGVVQQALSAHLDRNVDHDAMPLIVNALKRNVLEIRLGDSKVKDSDFDAFLSRPVLHSQPIAIDYPDQGDDAMAALEKGGIDLNPDTISTTIEQDGFIVFETDPALLSAFEDIEGVIPSIRRISTLQNLRNFLTTPALK